MRFSFGYGVSTATLLLFAVASCAPDERSRRRDSSDGSPDVATDAASTDGPSPRRDGNDVTRDGSPMLPYPALLSETGLFDDVKNDVLSAGVRPFQPQYVLWSDGATKRRWVYFPDGAQIDTSDMDYWKYPVGTKVWKEFTVNGVRVETRLQYKSGPNKSDWVMIAYQWRSDLSDADAVPDGVQNARGTDHDIPQVSDCLFCHGNMKDSLLGVTAIQLSHTLPGLTITDLMSEGRLSNPPAAPFVLPGDKTARDALGYLHANCGTCHNPQSSVYSFASLRLWESTSALASVETTTAYQTAVGRPNAALPQYPIIDPGSPDTSEMILRMSVRGTASPPQMPPLATEIVDTTGVGLVRAWIASLPRPTDGGVRDASVADAADGGG